MVVSVGVLRGLDGSAVPKARRKKRAMKQCNEATRPMLSCRSLKFMGVGRVCFLVFFFLLLVFVVVFPIVGFFVFIYSFIL